MPKVSSDPDRPERQQVDHVRSHLLRMLTVKKEKKKKERNTLRWRESGQREKISATSAVGVEGL